MYVLNGKVKYNFTLKIKVTIVIISTFLNQCRLVNDSIIDAVRSIYCDLNLSACVAPDSVGTLTKQH